MYRFTLVLIAVCIVAIATFSVQAENDESDTASEKSCFPGWFRVDTEPDGPLAIYLQRAPLLSQLSPIRQTRYCRARFTSSNSN